MKIQVIPKVISPALIDKLMQDINPKVNATDMTYFAEGNNVGVKKIKCTEHPIVQHICNNSGYFTESVSIVYYPTGSYNTPHSDNCINDNGNITKVKDWTHTGVIFLNNDFTGGELVYPDQGCVFLPTIGTMIIAPADAGYIHYVNQITSGERYTLVFRFI